MESRERQNARSQTGSKRRLSFCCSKKKVVSLSLLVVFLMQRRRCQMQMLATFILAVYSSEGFESAYTLGNKSERRQENRVRDHRSVPVSILLLLPIAFSRQTGPTLKNECVCVHSVAGRVDWFRALVFIRTTPYTVVWLLNRCRESITTYAVFNRVIPFHSTLSRYFSQTLLILLFPFFFLVHFSYNRPLISLFSVQCHQLLCADRVWGVVHQSSALDD